MVLVPHSAPCTSQGLCQVLGEQWGAGETVLSSCSLKLISAGRQVSQYNKVERGGSGRVGCPGKTAGTQTVLGNPAEGLAEEGMFKP